MVAFLLLVIIALLSLHAYNTRESLKKVAELTDQQILRHEQFLVDHEERIRKNEDKLSRITLKKR